MVKYDLRGDPTKLGRVLRSPIVTKDVKREDALGLLAIPIELFIVDIAEMMEKQ